MACGVPVIARDIRSLRETGGAGATYVKTDEPSDWASALRRWLEDEAEYDRARKLAVDAAASFSWTSAAQRLLERAAA
jgi:glycosyltransferase involved in cell wall biosynthesis